MQGQGAEGLTQLCQGLEAYQASGQAFQRPHFLAMLAEVYGSIDQSEEGMMAITEALALVEQTGERYYEAELHRLKGEFLMLGLAPDVTQAESCFHQAIFIAQNQSAKWWGLRAATSLARLWQSQGKRQEAHDLLAPVYEWFTEGFDTADLKEARALLDELAR